MGALPKGTVVVLAACGALGALGACSDLVGITDFTAASADSGAQSTRDGSSSSGSSSGSDGGTPVIFFRGYATATDHGVDGGQTLSPTLDWAQSTGDLIVLLTNYDASLGLSQVSDTSGNVYTQFGSTASGTDYHEAMYYCLGAKAAGAGANTVTVEQSAPGTMGDFSVNVFGFSAPGRTWVQDQYVHNSQGIVSAVSTGAVTTTHSDEVLVAGTGVQNLVVAGSGGSWITEPTDGLGDRQEFMIVDSIQTDVAATFAQQLAGLALSQLGTFAATP